MKTLLGGDNLIEVNNLAADPLIKPAQIVDGATWTRTMGWTEYQQVRYATARSVFKWDGSDTVKVGSDETPVRVLDEEVSTDGRAGITATGSTAKGKFASRNSISARIISR